ncbi:MAG: hypothetical protein K0Q76_3316 [Panacagrimonas sp.]|jgi:hypothetical protein|nr:hypothetical protein [Panacagrimonas sp.]MCC2658208.1 hypothetical protein [Panacagrimonas sp.]
MNATYALAPIALLALLASATPVGAQSPADADVNRDGVVSPMEAEYSATLRMRFDQLDRNRDGRLDPTETSGLAPAPPGALPTLPEGATGRAAGVVTSGSGMAGATAHSTPGRVTGTGASAVPNSSMGSSPYLPATSNGPASGSPFGSPYGAPAGSDGTR